MPTQIPLSLLQQLMRQETSDVVLTLLTLDHPAWEAPIRLVNNSSDIVSRGNVYTAFPFSIVLPPDDGETTREANITMDNTSLEIIGFLRSVIDEIPATIEVILARLPNEVQMDIPDLVVRSINYNKNRITAVLSLDSFLNTELTSEKYTPAKFPGLF